MEEKQEINLFEEKFNLWNKKLLDLSKKNRLLNYKERRTGTFVLEGISKFLFDDLVAADGYEFQIKSAFPENEKDVDKVKERTRKLEYIRKQIKSTEDEMGFNVGYAAFGMMEWKETEDADKSIQSPIVLVPIKIERKDLASPIFVKLKEDEDITFNPVLVKKLHDDFGIDVDEHFTYTALPEALNYISEKTSSLGWQIVEKAVIDTFNFQNLVIQKDLEKNKEMLRKNPFIKALTEGKSSEVEKLFDHYNEPIDIKSENSKDRLQIFDADSSQQEAISRARRGDSFVLQGPPGTGKSQTISNIIAEQIGMGKQVLFVSEKQAALDVVYHKLQQKGLSEFLLTLHNTKQKKGEIRTQLRESLNLSQDSYTLKEDSFSLYNTLNEETIKLNDYDELVHEKNRPVNRSFYYLHGKLTKVLKEDDLLFNVEGKALNLSYEEMEGMFQKVEELGKMYITNTFRYKENGWQYFKRDPSLTKITEISQLGKDFVEKTAKRQDFQNQIQEILPNIFLESTLKEDIKKLHQLMLQKPSSVNAKWFALDLDQMAQDIENLQDLRQTKEDLETETVENLTAIQTVFEDEFLKTENVDELVKALKYQYNSFFARIFSGKYRAILKRNKQLTKTLKLSYQELVENLEKLGKVRENEEELPKVIDKIKATELYISDELDKAVFQLQASNLNQWLKEMKWLQQVNEVVYIETWLVPIEVMEKMIDGSLSIDWHKLEELAELKDENFKDLSSLKKTFKENFTLETEDVEKMKDLLAHLDFDMYKNFFIYQNMKNELIEEYGLKDFMEKVEGVEIPAQKVFPIFLKRYLLLVLEHHPNYSKITSVSSKDLHTRIKNFKKNDTGTFAMARDRIFKELVDRLPNVNENMKVTGGEIAILKKELTKKTRFMSTRKLIENLSSLLPRLKPCIMMSPITVSTYFSSNPDWQFDLVIFDEASQVRPEYAVAAISRGKQIIVAGDSKQMPPTAFFDANGDVEDLNEDEADIQDLESILDEFSVAIPETYLNWHYRSEDESLIAFSNDKFYNNRLYTFPTGNSDVHSHVLFHYVADGVWESKNGNPKEADKVVVIVKDIAMNHPHKSLGIVTFGLSQARVIKDKILELRENNPELEPFFDENKQEPFFVKNLENVQGDERDIILLGVGYGKDPNGKLRMNFGPLTQSGGGRRLNVAVSRAKEQMQIISSIKGTDIVVDNTSNENRVIFRDFLEFAEKGMGALVGYSVAEEERVPEFDSDFEENVYDFLIAKGYKVHTQVGASGYRIDMAVLHPTIPGRYVLAIECDGAAYHSSKTARDRDRLRQEILESKGWNFFRIWSTTWIHDNVNEKNHLVDAIDKAIDNYSNKETLEMEDEAVDKMVSNLVFEVMDEDGGENLPDIKGDVYDFEDNIEGLADIIRKIAKKYVGYTTTDIMRHINQEVFDKSRLTQGNQEVYEKAFQLLEGRGVIEVEEGVIRGVE